MVLPDSGLPQRGRAGFGKAYRILKTDEFSSVFSFRRTHSSEFFQIFVKANGLTHARLGLVVAKKVAQRAVARNYIKRTIRETFRRERTDLPAVDLVIRCRRRFSRCDGDAARHQLKNLFARIAACHAYSSP